jgi:hypothetical protein
MAVLVGMTVASSVFAAETKKEAVQPMKESMGLADIEAKLVEVRKKNDKGSIKKLEMLVPVRGRLGRDASPYPEAKSKKLYEY